jgi:serum/glucocorticoid-regulated kinase 2
MDSGSPTVTHAKLGIDHFTILSLLSVGNSSNVLLVRKKDCQDLFVMKIYSKKKLGRSEQVRRIQTEQQILRENLASPFLVKLHCSFQTRKKLFLVMDYCPGGDLFSVIHRHGRLTEGQTRFYCAQIVIAIEHLHSLGIVYRDLKPENVLIDHQGYIKLADFGLSKLTCSSDQKIKSMCGTPEYFAPEIITAKEYGREVDYWSLGCIILEMLTGNPPFYNSNPLELFSSITTKKPKLPPFISQELGSLIASLLEKDPSKRLTTNSKSHPWFKNVNWGRISTKKYASPFTPEVGADFGLSNFQHLICQSDNDFPTYSGSKRKSSASGIVKLDNFSWQENM